MTISTGNSYLDSLTGNPKSGGTATTKKSNQTLDQSSFLKLLTTQMTTQDPFDPVDNTQMVAQMAQFSSTTGIAEMNQSLKSISTALASSRGRAPLHVVGPGRRGPSRKPLGRAPLAP